MRSVELPGGESVPVLGIGTWYMGDQKSRFDQEVKAVRYAVDRGLRLIDTAEMYGDGGAEEVVGEAVRDCRDDVFIVSKVYPHNAGYESAIEACERSLNRLGTDRIDVYLLHWRGSAPFEETLRAFETLRSSGKIRYFGVSNLDAADMDEWWSCPGGDASVTNQVLYNLSRRGVEWDVLPGCRKRGVPAMAYSPLEQGRLQGTPVLSQIARRHGVEPLQIALAWVLAQPGVIAIPKAIEHSHIDQNIAALDIVLNAEDLTLLDEAFPPPTGPSHLEML